MNTEPLKVAPGVLCEVVGGMAGDQSPNLGLVVKVTRLVGFREPTSADDPYTGKVWECLAEYSEAPPNQRLKRRIEPGHRDFLEQWLRPLPPEKQPGLVKETEITS